MDEPFGFLDKDSGASQLTFFIRSISETIAPVHFNNLPFARWDFHARQKQPKQIPHKGGTRIRMLLVSTPGGQIGVVVLTVCCGAFTFFI